MYSHIESIAVNIQCNVHIIWQSIYNVVLQSIYNVMYSHIESITVNIQCNVQSYREYGSQYTM